jgi:hypothetical protein
MMMTDLAKAVRVLSVLALAGGVGVFIGWIKSNNGDVHPITVPPGANQPAIPIEPAGISPDTTPLAVNTNIRTARHHRPKPAPEPSLPPEENMEWEKQLDDVLLTDTDPNTKADRILALIPTAPTNAQVELSQHLVNMVQDDHYDGAAQLLTNAATPAEVSTVLMNDLLNRNNTLKLPMLLAVARDDDHPLRGQAREMLELLLQQDDGTNWDQWSDAVNTWLQNNAQ